MEPDKKSKIQNNLISDMFDINTSTGLYTNIFLAGVVGGLAFLAQRYRICKPEEIMIRTGIGIKDMLISKRGFVLPFQKSFVTTMTPKTFNFDLHNMSKEKVEFKLPVTFTTAPIHPDDDINGFKRFAKFMHNIDTTSLKETLGGMIEGEVRVLTASMTVEEMFSSKDKFHEHVVKNISRDLDKVGIRILNANIREMSDYDAHNKFFEFRKQRAIQSANYDAQSDVAEAQTKGEIGIKNQEADRRIKIAELEMNSKTQENTRQAQIVESEATLGEASALSKRRIQIANIETDIASREKQIVLEKQLFEKAREKEIERMRSIELSDATVKAEAKVMENEGTSKAMRIIADAEFYKKQKEAEGIKAIYDAQSEGVRKILSSASNNPDLVKFYMALDKNLYQDLASKGVESLKGLNPKITIWNTGSDNSTKNPLNPIINMAQSINPLFQGMKENGMIMPSWMPKFDDSADTNKNNEFDNSTNTNKNNDENINDIDDINDINNDKNIDNKSTQKF